jgi:cytidyltransferase-like protein
MNVLVSGGFDPVHSGHVMLLTGAHQLGRVYVALNSDAWLKKKKGYVFMPWSERSIVLRQFVSVYRVIPVNDDDGTVVEAIVKLRPDYFVNGGDRTSANPAEHEACLSCGTKELFGIGGGKIASSSQLVAAVR